MKRKLLACLSIGSLLMSAAMCVSFSLNQKEYKVEAYVTSSLPTTIDLNDSTTAEIQSYYADLSSLDVNERNGNNLLKNLKPILKNGQKYYSYDSGDTIWRMYEITDRDWEKSPADEVANGTYNSSTNTITGYKYKASTGSDVKNPYIHALYINRDVENETRAWGNHNQDMWGINREHIWPKSHGFENEANGGARGDPMHLWAGNGYSNNIHGNLFYGNVNRSSITTDCGAKYANQKGNYLGLSSTVGSGTVFEPQDCDKGDIARAVFYMVARYNYLSGSDTDGISADNPNLELTQESSGPSKGYMSTTTTTGKLGIISDLLAWNELN